MEFVSLLGKEIGSIIGFIIAGLAGYLLPQLSNKFKLYLQQRWFNASLKKSMELKIKLAELKGKLDAQRIYFMQFHNGKVFLGDNQFHKYSVSSIFEVVDSGLSREIQNMQSIPLSNYAELIYKMQKDDQDMVLVGDHRSCDIGFVEADLNDVKYTINPKTILYVKVKNNSNVFVGLLALYFDEEIIKSDILKEIKAIDDLDSILNYIRKKI